MQSNEKAKVPAQKHSKPYNSMNKGGSNRANQRQRQNTQNIAIPSNAFVALFPYKPQKTDELELKKGCKFVQITPSAELQLFQLCQFLIYHLKQSIM